MNKGDAKGYYSGYKSCGCFVAVMVDMFGYEVETAKTLREWGRYGYRVEYSQEKPDLSKFNRCTCNDKELLFK